MLYFYPKDDTSGCTREAQDFTALARDFEKAGVKILGVSRDPMKKHEKFIDKYGLAVPLVADEDGRISDVFGTWVEKSMYGRKYMGMERATFLIGADGRILRVWRKVKVPGHAQEALRRPGGLARASAQHHLPEQDIVVHRAHRNSLVEAMGALVDRRNAPASVDVVNRNSLGPEKATVARARGHHRIDMHRRAVEAPDRFGAALRTSGRSGDVGLVIPR